MTYEVEVEHKAARALIRIARGDHQAAARIKAAIDGLAEEPRPSGTVKLTGADAYRIRVGDYRVVYVVEDAVRVVVVVRIAHRREVYER